MIDFLSLLDKITATPARKLELKTAFAKQVGWETTIIDAETGEEIDNPITFRQMFNRCVWEYIRQTCVAGKKKLLRERAEADDTFEDLVKL